MKVERVEVEPFVPIKITLQSEAEADKMYFLLNMAPAMSLVERCKEDNKDIVEIDNFQTALWNKLVKHHRPKRCR